MTSKEFVKKVYALNSLANVDKVQAVAKKLFPDCRTVQMGYDGGYSDVILDGEMELRDYGNKLIPEETIKDDVFENLGDTDMAFGTIGIEIGEEFYQIYTLGIGQWQVDITDEDGGTDVEMLDSYKNAITYIENLKKKDNKMMAGGSLEQSENRQMVMNNNKQIKHHTEELANAVRGNKQVPAWVVAKVNRSATDLSDATHYLEGESEQMKTGGSVGKVTIKDVEWANDDNKQLGTWLLTSVDGNKILSSSKNGTELEKNVMAYYKKKGSVAKMTWDDDADDGLSWVTFTDLFNEINSIGKTKMAKGGGVGSFTYEIGGLI
jgi:ribosomal protein L39E